MKKEAVEEAICLKPTKNNEVRNHQIKQKKLFSKLPFTLRPSSKNQTLNKLEKDIVENSVEKPSIYSSSIVFNSSKFKISPKENSIKESYKLLNKISDTWIIPDGKDADVKIQFKGEDLCKVHSSVLGSGWSGSVTMYKIYQKQFKNQDMNHDNSKMPLINLEDILEKSNNKSFFTDNQYKDAFLNLFIPLLYIKYSNVLNRDVITFHGSVEEAYALLVMCELFQTPNAIDMCDHLRNKCYLSENSEICEDHCEKVIRTALKFSKPMDDSLEKSIVLIAIKSLISNISKTSSIIENLIFESTKCNRLDIASMLFRHSLEAVSKKTAPDKDFNINLIKSDDYDSQQLSNEIMFSSKNDVNLKGRRVVSSKNSNFSSSPTVLKEKNISNLNFVTGESRSVSPARRENYQTKSGKNESTNTTKSWNNCQYLHKENNSNDYNNNINRNETLNNSSLSSISPINSFSSSKISKKPLLKEQDKRWDRRFTARRNNGKYIIENKYNTLPFYDNHQKDSEKYKQGESRSVSPNRHRRRYHNELQQSPSSSRKFDENRSLSECLNQSDDVFVYYSTSSSSSDEDNNSDVNEELQKHQDNANNNKSRPDYLHSLSILENSPKFNSVKHIGGISFPEKTNNYTFAHRPNHIHSSGFFRKAKSYIFTKADVTFEKKC